MRNLSRQNTALTSEVSKTHRVIVSPKRRKDGRYVCIKAGPVFDVCYGIETICSSVNPFYVAARILKERGRTGLLEMWHVGADYPSLTMPIDQAANRTIKEGERLPISARYSSFQGRAENVRATSVPPLPQIAAGELAVV